jgi:hypothetical protein
MGTKVEDHPEALELEFSVPEPHRRIALRQKVVFGGQIVLGVVCIVQVGSSSF